MKLTPQAEILILELFKCHYTPIETAKYTGYSEPMIYALFRAFRITNQPKYNRKTLTQLPSVNHPFNSLSLPN